MAKLNVDPLSTSQNETVDICIKELFQNPETLLNEISKNYCRNLLNLATKKVLHSAIWCCLKI